MQNSYGFLIVLDWSRGLQQIKLLQVITREPCYARAREVVGYRITRWMKRWVYVQITKKYALFTMINYIYMVPQDGLEPPTYYLRNSCSTD